MDQINNKMSALRSSLDPKHKVGLVNLGCVRNLVDAQDILTRLKETGHNIVEAGEAETVILNTCSFIEDAKRESIDAILELIDLKKQGKIKKIIVAGCLPQRYGDVLSKEFEEVDAFMGIHTLLKDSTGGSVFLTPRHFTYVKICESCYNHCRFCAIPMIKGKFSSRSIEAILSEVNAHDARGVKEINIIGQDITAYGIDLYKKKSLSRLLKEITKTAKNIEWIRLLYAFPSHITDELIDVVAGEEKICKYIDVPFQHISDPLLKAMNRNITKQETAELIEKIRSRIPEVILRTSFIVGLPGETEKDFEELVDFVREIRFEKLGVFMYSKEEGTPAFDMQKQVPAKIKEERYNILMREQQSISEDIQQSYVGRVMKVLIDEKEKDEENIYLGRTEYDAPDVDGLVVVRADKELSAGDFVDIRITASLEYDLEGELA